MKNAETKYLIRLLFAELPFWLFLIAPGCGTLITPLNYLINTIKYFVYNLMNYELGIDFEIITGLFGATEWVRIFILAVVSYFVAYAVIAKILKKER